MYTITFTLFHFPINVIGAVLDFHKYYPMNNILDYDYNEMTYELTIKYDGKRIM